MTQPTIALAMIIGGSPYREGGNGVEALKACLESARPVAFDQIVLVDTGVNDAALEVITAESEARIALGLTPIETPKFDWIGNFAAARNESFRHVATDWAFWMDDDDVMEDADQLRSLLDGVPDDVGGFWLPYLYAFDEQGNCTTLLDRERLLRVNVGWDWQGWLHESMVPRFPVAWGRSDKVTLRHTSRHSTRTDRNMPILMKWMAAEPHNIRIKLFIGNQWFAEQDWQKAVKWYAEFWQDGRGNPYDRFQAATYGARAARELHNLAAANIADLQAVTLFPDWADGWIGLAENALQAERWQQSVTYCEIAASRKPADKIVMVNPLDYTWRLERIWTKALAEVGEYEQALLHCERGLMVRPADKEDIANRDRLQVAIERQEAVKSFMRLTAKASQRSVLTIASGLEDGLMTEKAVRDVVVPLLIRGRRGTKPTAIIFCGQSVEQWAAPTPGTTGIGGSETAVVEIANRMAADGWGVEVYNNSGPLEGIYDGVLYADWQRFNFNDNPDLLISWRNPKLGTACPKARQRWLWQHDLNYGDQRDLTQFDLVCGVSAWHADYLRRCYPYAAEHISYLPNGIDLDKFKVEPTPTRVPFRCVYSSSPDRGLETLLRLWPQIVRAEPAAELHIFYGWESLMATARHNVPQLYDLRKRVEDSIAQMPSVKWRGRVSQQELAKEFLQADAWLYPAHFVEVFCITAYECMAAGVLPVVSAVGNLPYAVGEAGLEVWGQSRGAAFGEAFVDASLRALQDVGLRHALRNKGIERAQAQSWDKVYEEHWKPKLERVCTS
uniref:Putative glycosyltransferase n=1 Tax=viral metagenome TaxID=1070528 RepID=A0A6M3IYV5_9ZZZZ